MTDLQPAVPLNGGGAPPPSPPSAPNPVWPRVVVAAALLAVLGAVIGGAVGISRGRDTRTTAQNQPIPSASALPSPSDDTTAQAGTAECTVDCPPQGGDTNKNRTTSVPNVVGLDEPTARKKLSDRGLGAKVQYVCYDQGQNVVLKQSPYAETTVNTGSNVSLDVRGATVLHVVGQYHADAKAKLEQAGFNVVVNNRQNGAAGGAVTSQSPGGNSCVKYGSTVTINVGQNNPSPSASANGG